MRSADITDTWKKIELKERDGFLSKSEERRLESTHAKCESQIEFLGKLWSDWGVTIVAGTDAIQAFGDYCLGLELQVEAGMSPMDVIRSATVEAARSVGLGDVVGTIEPGKEADLVVVDQDPLKDIRALRDMRVVIKKGQIVPAVPAMAESD